MSKGEPVVIDPKLIKYRRVQIPNVNWIFYDIITVVVRLAVFETLFDPSSCEPSCETTSVMISSVVVLG